MEKRKVWFDFIEKANKMLKQGQEIDTFQPPIQIVFEPVFDNHISLQLDWRDDNVNWHHSIYNLLTSIKNNSPF